MVELIRLAFVPLYMSGNNTHSLDGVGVWGGGVTGGLIAGIAMGLVLHLGGNQIELLGGLATDPSTAVASVGRSTSC